MNFKATIVFTLFHIIVAISAEELVKYYDFAKELSSSSSELSEEQIFITDTLRLIEAGNAKISLDDGTKEIVLAIGLTGAGKTTLTKFIATPETLEAYDTGYSFLIRDNKRTISDEGTIVSKTIFPERLLDSSSDHVYFDMPGFSDTRNTSIEIANAWFMKKVANHASSVKLLFIVSHSTLKFGEHQNIFLTLLTHATDFIKEPKKFENAISLIVSKVDISEGTSTEEIIEGIADFLLSVKANLGQVTTDPEKQRTASELIDAFLSLDSEGKYTKISFFKQPNQVGPLTTIPDVMEQRYHMKQVIENNTVFVKSSPEDFGISVSPGGQLLSLSLSRITYENITSVITSIQNKIDGYYATAITNGSLNHIGSVVKSFKKLEIIPTVLKNFTSTREFLYQLALSLVGLNHTVLSTDIIKLQNFGSNLQFFKDLTGQKVSFNSKEWSRPIKLTVESTKSKIDRKLSEVNNDVIQLISEISAQFQNDFIEKLTNKHQDEDKLMLNQEMRNLSQALKIFIDVDAWTTQSYNEFSSQFQIFLHPYGKSFEKMMLTDDVEIQGKNCNLTLPLKLHQWLVPLKALRKEIRSKIQKLEIQIHDSKLHQEITTLSNLITTLESSATEQLRKLKLEKANFQIQLDIDRERWNTQYRLEEENCRTKMSNANEIYTLKLQNMREAHDQLKSSYQLDIRQEKVKTESTQNTCLERVNTLNGAIQHEREAYGESFNEIQRTMDNQDAQARQFHLKSLQQVDQTCRESLQNQEEQCSSQARVLEATIEHEKTEWEEKIQDAQLSCEKNKTAQITACTLQKTTLEEHWKRESKQLRDDLEIVSNTCSQDLILSKITCKARVALKRAELIKLEQEATDAQNKQEETCSVKKRDQLQKHGAELARLNEEISDTTRKASLDCEKSLSNLKNSVEQLNYKIHLQSYKTMAEDSEWYMNS